MTTQHYINVFKAGDLVVAKHTWGQKIENYAIAIGPQHVITIPDWKVIFNSIFYNFVKL